jgi:hypothetical protein
MPGLREEVIAVICEEWQKGQDREAEVTAAMISERLQRMTAAPPKPKSSKS